MISIGFLLVFSNTWVVRAITNWWEIPTVKTKDLSSHAGVAVVLSGVVDVFRGDDDRVFLKEGADRILHAAYLYRKKIVNKILVSGTFLTTDGQNRDESKLIKQVLLDSGVKSEDVWLEAESRNTYENAKFSALELKKRGVEGPVILVTSAFHMRRARAAFKKQGRQVVPWSVDFQFDAGGPVLSIFGVLPKVVPLSIFTRLLREWVGMAVYLYRDYI